MQQYLHEIGKSTDMIVLQKDMLINRIDTIYDQYQDEKDYPAILRDVQEITNMLLLVAPVWINEHYGYKLTELNDRLWNAVSFTQDRVKTLSTNMTRTKELVDNTGRILMNARQLADMERDDNE